MGMNTLWSFVVCSIGFVLIGILLYKNKVHSTRWLAFFLFTLAYGCFLYFLFESKYLLNVPFFFRTGWISLYLAPQALLFYVLYLIDEKRKLKWYDALHLIPVLFYLIDFFPFLISDNDYKRDILNRLYENKPEAVFFREGWFVPEGLHYYLRHFIGLGYASYITLMLWKSTRPEVKSLLRNPKMRQWLFLIVGNFMVFSLFGLITYLFSFTRFSLMANLWASIVMFACMVLQLLFRPEILYGVKLNVTPGKNNKPKPHSALSQFPPELSSNLRLFMEKRLYLEKNIKLQTVAEQLGVQPYILSAYINQIYHMRFNDLVNWCRVQYIKDGLIKGKWTMLTLEAVAEEAGFNNRTTFLAAFKRFTGVTPTAFVNGARNETIEKQFQSETSGLLTGIE
jgi:AraC-like DNA-binding protein